VREDILEKVTTDLLSIPPLIFREIRRKLIKTTLTDIDAGITPHHFEMTKLIDKLVDLELVERQTDVADRRTSIITLSPRGKAVLEEHRASLMNAIRETMGQLSDQDLKDLSDTLRRLQDILSKLHQGTPAGT